MVTGIWRIVDNEITVIGDLKSDTIRKFQVQKPVKKDFGKGDLTYIKEGAFTTLNALYRGNTLYFNMNIFGLNDLRDNYTPGQFTIKFMDEFDFIIHSAVVPMNELTGLVGDDKKTVEAYSYNGKTELSSDIYKAIKKYSVSSTVQAKSKSRSIWGW